RPPTISPFPYATLFRSCSSYRGELRSTRHFRPDLARNRTGLVPNARPGLAATPHTRHRWPACRLRPHWERRLQLPSASCDPIPRSEEHTSELQSLAYLV